MFKLHVSRIFLPIIAVICVWLLMAGRPLLAQDGFVKVQGDQFVCNGQIYKIKGTNYYPKNHMWADMWNSWNWSAIQLEADMIDQLGLNAVRILVPYSNGGWGGSTVNPLNLQRLEDLVNLLGSKGIRTCITLFDWETSFPATTDSRWNNHISHMSTIVNRFKNNRYVFMWDVKNEPDHPDNIGGGDNWDGKANKAKIVNWLMNMCNAIRAIDPNHPVSAGLRWYANIDDVASFVDIAICHSYWAPTPPSWPTAETQINHIRQFSNKPILFQEFGWPSGGVRTGSVFTETEQLGSYQGHLTAWTQLNIAGGIQWMTFNACSSCTNFESHFGLWRYDYSLKPAGAYYRDNFPVQQFPTDFFPPAEVTDLTATPGVGRILLSWKNPLDADLKGIIIRSSQTGYPANINDGQPVANITPATAGAQMSFEDGNRPPGQTYYYTVFTYDTSTNYSSGATASATPLYPNPTTIGQARMLPDGTGVYIQNAVVSGVFSDLGFAYVQDADRSAGIRVISNAGNLNPGDVVDVSGVVSTLLVNGVKSERAIQQAGITKTSTGVSPVPISFNNRTLGGKDADGLFKGVKDGVGPNSIGLLVKVSGKVAHVDGNSIYVDDGSGIQDADGFAGIKVLCAASPVVSPGSFAVLSGILTGDVPPGWTANRRLIRMRDANDLSIKRFAPGINGSVKNAWGEAVSGAQLALVPSGKTAVSDSQGGFRIHDINEGNYTLQITADGYTTKTVKDLTITEGQIIQQDITLESGAGRIWGFVTDGSGNSVPGATITTDPPSVSVTSGPDGAYLLTGLAPAYYLVTASKPNFESDTSSAVYVFADGSSRVELEIVPIPGERLINGSFEGGFWNYQSGNLIADNWQPAFRTEADRIATVWSSYDFGSNGGKVQQVYINRQGAGESGIMQTITGLTPGATYFFSASAYQTSTTSSCWIDVNADGSTTWKALNYAFNNIPGQWNFRQITGTVGATGTMTVFLKVWHQWNPAGTCYFNNASLIAW